MNMKKVITKNKGNHALFVKGKLIKFKDGLAIVEDADADTIKKMNNNEYIVEEPSNTRKKPKKKPKKKRKKEKRI